ncbi:conserved membrane hypothetical protein [Syntrophobacter sp. SbD1]|nr:conserved membrane hypothetical protein [Syntrophobacter sp. SbD1]
MLQNNLREHYTLGVEESPDGQSAGFSGLVDQGVISRAELEKIVLDSGGVARRIEESILNLGIEKHTILLCLSEYYSLPFIEFNESLPSPGNVLERLDLEELKRDLWFPLSVGTGEARVAVFNPYGPELHEKIKANLGAPSIRFIVALPSDITRMVEHSQDVNPNFPPAAGRTPLAVFRTRVASDRTVLAWYRTSMAKGRTGLALIRTGVSFTAISLTLLRIFGIGYLSILEAPLLLVGIIMAVEGITWYVPTRKLEPGIAYLPTRSTFGTSIPELKSSEEGPVTLRSEPVQGAEQLRTRWNRLSPVMRRRFFAIDRTDLAEERTFLVVYRTKMARARTGLAFTRTGISFVGLGTLLIRQFPPGLWSIFYGALIAAGLVMFVEGARWYFPGRRAGRESLKTIRQIEESTSIWDFMFRAFSRLDDLPPKLAIKSTHAPGIWGTTGLALERTLLAERRNVKSRLRTTMARSRTGLSFIRTGTSIFSVGLGLLVYFGWGNILWTLFDFTLMLAGLVLIADGLHWYISAERTRRQLPYCFEDLEIRMPDFGKPTMLWKKVIFSYEDNECRG